MNARQAIKLCLDQGDNIARMYLSDLSDADLLVRPVAGCNHIAWQLGHLIIAEHMFVSTLKPGSTTALPDGFQAAHSNETAASDDPKAFLTKQEYLELAAKIHAVSLAVLDQIPDDELDAPPPQQFAGYTRSVGDLLSLIGTHWTMHAGQWAVIRRKLGKPPMF